MKLPDLLRTLFTCGVLTLAMLQQCGTAPVAGGAGTGNPGKTTIAIVAEQVLQDSSGAASLLKTQSSEDFSITDADSNAFEILTSSIIVKRIHFNVEPKDKEYLREVSVIAPLRKDAGSVILEGPYTFNTLTGTTEPPIEPLLLPDANYKSVRLIISSGPIENSVYLAGNFTYKDKQHYFRFDLSLDANVTYEATDAIYISGSEVTELKITLDASQWLKDVYSDICISSRSVPFDATDTFFLDGKITDTTCTIIPETIKNNMVKSGKLKVKQVKVVPPAPLTLP